VQDVPSGSESMNVKAHILHSKWSTRRICTRG